MLVFDEGSPVQSSWRDPGPFGFAGNVDRSSRGALSICSEA